MSAAIVLLAAGAAVALGQSSDRPRLEPLSEVRPLPYHLGESFDGLPLTYVDVLGDGWRVDVGYGECRRRGSRLNPLDEDRCDYPVFVQTTRRMLELAGPYPAVSRWERCVRTEVLGVPAFIADRGLYNGLNLFTGQLEVAVMAERSRLRAAARSLRAADGVRRTRLPEPAAGVRSRIAAQCRVDPSAFEPVERKLEPLRRSNPELPFLGLEYEGARLDHVHRVGRTVTFYYEGCGTSGLSLTCTILARPTVHPPPARPPDTILSCSETEVNGAPGVFVEYEESIRMRQLVLFTDRYVVVIDEYGLGDEPLLRRARSLRPLREWSEPTGQLPPPVRSNRPVVPGCPR